MPYAGVVGDMERMNAFTTVARQASKKRLFLRPTLTSLYAKLISDMTRALTPV